MVVLVAVAGYPLGRVGSCLRPGIVRRPVISDKIPISYTRVLTNLAK